MHGRPLVFASFLLASALHASALAQGSESTDVTPPPPPPPTTTIVLPSPDEEEPPPAQKGQAQQGTQEGEEEPYALPPPPPGTPYEGAPGSDAPLEERSQGLPPPPPLTSTPEPPPAEEFSRRTDATMVDGHPREGAFLSSPGSLTFLLHHSLMGGVGGMMTQMVAKDFQFSEGGARQAMLAGLLIGAGVGFGSSAWWQFYNYIGMPMATFGLVNSAVGAMAAAGFLDLISQDKTLLAWGTLLGAELGAWLTAVVGGGEMTVDTGLLVSSGAGWAAIYTALMLGIIATTGNGSNLRTGIDVLLLSPAVGAGIMALANLRFEPTTAQIVRANLFGAGAGAAAMLISVLFLGTFNNPTPYVMGMVASAGAIATVSLLWADPVASASVNGSRRSRPYRNVWW